jgi:hypothetical protein
MIQPILSKNKQAFRRYNDFRKQVFLELSPKAGEAVPQDDDLFREV